MSRFSYYLPVLGYHKVGDPKQTHVPTVSAAAFERQLAFLARHRYRVLSLAEIADHVDQGRPFPRHSTAITFDDGYEETATVAWPLLRRYEFPAAVFVTVAEIGLAGFMSWDQVDRLAKDSMEIGCHTMHHAYLPRVNEQRLPEELVASKQQLEARLGRRVDFISYPIGGYTPVVQDVVRQAGYRAAFTTNRTTDRARLDRYALRRIKVTERDANPFRMAFKLSGYYDVFRRLHDPGVTLSDK